MENLNDVNNLDPHDEGLKAVMGSRFHDETTGGPAPAKKAAPAPAQSVEVKPEKKTHTAPVALWEPIKPDPNWLDHLKAAAKWAATFGGMGCLFFYWQVRGLMDPAAAMPSIVVCALLVGLGIGKHVIK